MNNNKLKTDHPKRLMILLLLTMIITACNTSVQVEEPAIPLAACQLTGNIDAECGTLTVPENRAAADPRTIDLNIAVLPATNGSDLTDPLFLLAGGPGQAATEAFPAAIFLFEEINKTRDLVLIDRRGTGKSNPLTCPALTEQENFDMTPDEFVTLLQDCAADLAQTADLTQYTTDIAMTDLEAVRVGLGYEKINLLGVSYGTRAAQAYARLYPQNVRTLVLDAVTSPELVLFLQAPRDGQRALDLLFARCEADAACREHFPDFRAEYTAVLAQLSSNTSPVPLTHPLSGETLTLELTRDQATQQIFNILYSTDLVALLPLLIHNAHESGDISPIISQALMLGDTAGINVGLLYAVTCTEDAPLIDLAEAKSLQQTTDFALQADIFVEACEAWPQGQLAADFRSEVETSIPTLLLSGNADPITPPNYAADLAARIPDSLHLVAPHYGHGTLAVGCTADLITQFIAAGTTADMNTTCFSNIQPPPFFVNLSGPQP